ncbi:MAG: hypothetical protein GQ469_08420 [Methanosarcinales archaeon]|nr:hypothetical protein [Methanosarcinales archaeon]
MTEKISYYPNCKLINPLLLGVKMFLAELRVWRNEYIEDHYVCSDFTQEVFNKATENGMRCGYVIISFEKSPLGHAIITFETDYGLVFIEPQTGEQVDVIVGKYYPIALVGVNEFDCILKIDIEWNDETQKSIVQEITPQKVSEVIEILESPNCITCNYVTWMMKYDNLGRIIKSTRVCSKINYKCKY